MSSAGNKGSDAEQCAAAFLQQQKLTLLERNYRCRFDAILISGERENEIEWIRNAFDES